MHDLAISGNSDEDKPIHERWARGCFSHSSQVNWAQVKGYVGIITTVNTIAIVVEFASRLCEKGIIEGACSVTLAMKNIKGTMLTTSLRSILNDAYVASVNTLSHTWSYPVDELIADRVTPSVEMSNWFFERFGWRNPSKGILRKDVEKFREELKI